MVYDAATNTTILFGGFNGTYLADTWSWNGSAWAKLTPATSPTGLRGASMVFDPLTNEVVLFGGLSSSGPVADTWTWNGTTWTKLLATGPAARWGATMAYDATTHSVVLFGGKGVSALLSDTWVWSGTSWSSPTLTAPTPTARYRASMAYDATTKNVVLFGGYDGTSALGDSWTWNGTSWTKLTVASPTARNSASMAYDAADSDVVLFGGTSGTSSLSDTWTFNGTSWSVQSTSATPSARYEAAFAYDSVANHAVLFGGYDGTSTFSDTWSFDVIASAPRSVKATSNANGQSVVTWSAPTSNGGSAILGYSVVASDSTTAANGGQTCDTTTATTCTLTGLTNGDHYVFAVAALTGVGTGTAASSNVAIPATVPGAPAITSVTPGAGQVSVKWTAPASTGGTPVASYRVTANGNRGFCHVPAKDLNCRITGLQNGLPYTFTMTATNAAGTSARSVVSAVVRPRTLPSAPVIISTSVAGRNIIIRWSAPKSNGGVRLSRYIVYVARYAGGEIRRPVASVSFRDRSYTFRGIGWHHYFVFVRAANVAGIGPHSNQVVVTSKY